MTSRQIEMTWRCTSCSAKNLGRFKVCQKCNNPKDGSEEYEMPEDPSTAASVTEAGLLAMATAGPNWRCAYCGSDQRRTDAGCASCGASAIEGAEVPDAPPPPPTTTRKPTVNRPEPSTRSFNVKVAGALVLAVISCLGFGAIASWNKNRPKDFEARVADVSWQRAIVVERFQAKPFEGFKENIPTDALEVKSLGQREHHQEQVFDHNETERYSVEVADGYRTETYSERESCGQDCTSSSQSCHESCKSNKNGFATCKTVCSGGGRSCTTKYCNKTKTRQIAKTRSEPRTRQVPRYRSEPRYAEAFSWTHWQWGVDRQVNASGTDVTVRWPESNLNKGLAQGEKEREIRQQKYEVSLSYGENQSLTFAPDDEFFAKFAPGTKHSIHTEQGTFTLDGVAVTPSR